MLDMRVRPYATAVPLQARQRRMSGDLLLEPKQPQVRHMVRREFVADVHGPLRFA